MEPTIKEIKLCKLYINNIEMDEWLVIDYNAVYIVCHVAELMCWEVQKQLIKEFMHRFYRRAENVEVHCP